MYIICYIIIIYCKIINYNYYKYKYLNNTFKYQTYYLKQRSIYCDILDIHLIAIIIFPISDQKQMIKIKNFIIFNSNLTSICYQNKKNAIYI